MRVAFAVAGFLVASWMVFPSAAQMQGPMHGQGQMQGQMQRRGQMGMGPMTYDTTTEVTLKGSVEMVENVTQQQRMGSQNMGGTHLTLKTDKETVDVRVGPSSFLTEHKMSLAKGDKIEVTGSRVKFGDAEAVVAREIKKGDQTLTLRNAQGVPAWAGGHMGGPS
jgi:hypothetical protein